MGALQALTLLVDLEDVFDTAEDTFADHQVEEGLVNARFLRSMERSADGHSLPG